MARINADRLNPVKGHTGLQLGQVDHGKNIVRIRIARALKQIPGKAGRILGRLRQQRSADHGGQVAAAASLNRYGRGLGHDAAISVNDIIGIGDNLAVTRIQRAIGGRVHRQGIANKRHTAVIPGQKGQV